MADLLGLALEGHGGLERWRRVRELVVRARSGGFALASRLQPRAFRSYEARVAMAEPRVVITPFGRPGHRGVFEGEDVRIETLDGAVVAERRRARSAFPGGRRALWWDPLDALYFGGYALWNYFSLPLLLARADVVAREIEPRGRGGGALAAAPGRVSPLGPHALPGAGLLLRRGRPPPPPRLHGAGLRALGPGGAPEPRAPGVRRPRPPHPAAGAPPGSRRPAPAAPHAGLD